MLHRILPAGLFDRDRTVNSRPNHRKRQRRPAQHLSNSLISGGSVGWSRSEGVLRPRRMDHFNTAFPLLKFLAGRNEISLVACYLYVRAETAPAGPLTSSERALPRTKSGAPNGVHAGSGEAPINHTDRYYS